MQMDKILLSAGELPDKCFAAVERNAVDAVEDDAVADERDGREPQQQHGGDPKFVQKMSEQKSKRADAEYGGLHAHAGEGSGVRGALAAESAEIEFFRRVDRKQVADGHVRECRQN